MRRRDRRRQERSWRLCRRVRARTESVCSAHASAIRRPVATLPVKKTFAGPASMIAAPSSPPPCRICTRPFGKPARSISSPTSAPVAGVSSEGFSSTAFPATRAGINSVIGIAKGKFQGEIIATTPMWLEFEPTGFRFQRDVVVWDAFRAQPPRRLAREEVSGVEMREALRRGWLRRGACRFRE